MKTTTVYYSNKAYYMIKYRKSHNFLCRTHNGIMIDSKTLIKLYNMGFSVTEVFGE